MVTKGHEMVKRDDLQNLGIFAGYLTTIRPTIIKIISFLAPILTSFSAFSPKCKT
jgi:hypothetical protein